MSVQKILLSFIVFFSLQIECRAETIVNTEIIGFSDDGDFLAIYSYTSYSESYFWGGQLVIIDVKNNKSIDSLKLEKDYKQFEDLPSSFKVNDLLKNILAKNTLFLDNYGIKTENKGYLSYYQSIHSYLLENNDCMYNPKFQQNIISIPVSSSHRLVTTSMCCSRGFNINFETTIVDELDINEDGLGCSECIKKFRLKIIDEESDKLIFDFENQLNFGNCYRDYFIGSIHFYGENKIAILVYGIRTGLEGLTIEPIFITTRLTYE